MTDTSLAGLRAAIDHAGYYPELVADAVDAAVAGEQIEAFVVHQETTFDSEEVRRHITVLVLTPGRLVLGHADDHPADAVTPGALRHDLDRGGAAARRSARSWSTASSPTRWARGGGGLPQEVTVTIGWGAVSRIDLEPAACGDPDCDADHGYTGTASADDIALRVSEAAEGADAVDPGARLRGCAVARDRALTSRSACRRRPATRALGCPTTARVAGRRAARRLRALGGLGVDGAPRAQAADQRHGAALDVCRDVAGLRAARRRARASTPCASTRTTRPS